MTLKEAKEIIEEISKMKGKEIREPEQLRGEPEKAYKALGLVLAERHTSGTAKDMAGWLAGNRHRFVPFLVGKGWWNARVEGLDVWAKATIVREGDEALEKVLERCFFPEGMIGKDELSRDWVSNALDCEEDVMTTYGCDIGCLRLRLDGAGEVFFNNGLGDGEFHVYVQKKRLENPFRNIVVCVERSLEIGTYDCGIEFTASLSLPAGRYEINAVGFGEIVIVKLS